MSVPFFLSVTQPKGNFHPGSGDWVKLHHVDLCSRGTHEMILHTQTHTFKLNNIRFICFRPPHIEKMTIWEKNKPWCNHNIMQGHWFPQKSSHVCGNTFCSPLNTWPTAVFTGLIQKTEFVFKEQTRSIVVNRTMVWMALKATFPLQMRTRCW